MHIVETAARRQEELVHVAMQVAIERDLARPPRQTCPESFAKECLCSGDAAIRPKQKIHRLAVLVDCPIGIIELAANVYISFIILIARMDTLAPTRQYFFDFK